MISHILFVLFSYVGPFTIAFWNDNAKDPLIFFLFPYLFDTIRRFQVFSCDWWRKIKGNYVFWSFVNKKVYKLAVSLEPAAFCLTKKPIACFIVKPDIFTFLHKLRLFFKLHVSKIFDIVPRLDKMMAEYQKEEVRIKFPRIHHPDCILMLKISTRTLQHQLLA